MLNITLELINYLKHKETSYAIIDSYVNSILKVGKKEDVDPILEYYLSNTFNCKFSSLFPLFKKFGDQSYAEKLFELYTTNHEFFVESAPEILELLGGLNLEEIKNILIDYAFGDDSDYYLSRSAILGLLSFDCKEYEDLIKAEIAKCYTKNFFREYVPALVCKLKNNEKYLEKLFILGSEYASTDCNAGIVLSFSLCGEIGRKYFVDALKDPHWELDSYGTGTIWATYQGFTNLKITFKEFYLIVKEESDNDKLDHLLSVLFAILDMRIRDYDGDHLESYIELFQIFFECENPNLIDLARKFDRDDEAYVLERKLNFKITEELLVRSF